MPCRAGQARQWCHSQSPFVLSSSHRSSSFPRKRESSRYTRKSWTPACVGVTMVDMDLEFTPQDGLPIPFRVHECMLTEARAAFPREACGLLLGDPGRITHALPARNVHARPDTHFEIAPQALTDRTGGHTSEL